MPVLSVLTRDLLLWLNHSPRTYRETMDAWRSHCPRLTIWEDALADGFVRVRSGDDDGQPPMVVLTDRGRAVLDGERGSTARSDD